MPNAKHQTESAIVRLSPMMAQLLFGDANKSLVRVFPIEEKDYEMVSIKDLIQMHKRNLMVRHKDSS